MIAELGCVSCGKVFERYLRRWTDPNPPCEECGSLTARLISRFNAPLNEIEPHVAYRMKSSRKGENPATGQPIPEKVMISSRLQQKEFVRLEGLTDPGDLNPNIGASEDGMISSSRERGSWV